MREFARARGATVRYVRLSPGELRVTDEDVAAALGHGARQPGRGAGRSHRRGLFAYPAQSNFSGVQHPLAWVDLAQAAGYDVLLDAVELVGLPSGGAVRVSLGLVSNLGDVERFLDFAERTYRNAEPDREGLAPRLRC
jgi:selenocysteine lyase/cysteine desulfurase